LKINHLPGFSPKLQVFIPNPIIETDLYQSTDFLRIISSDLNAALNESQQWEIHHRQFPAWIYPSIS